MGRETETEYGERECRETECGERERLREYGDREKMYRETERRIREKM